MYIANLFRHIGLVIRHKHKVFIHCAKCGLVWRGMVHDLSKFHPTELFESAAFYKGYRSPIDFCRKERGMSKAWLHHRAKNKHHIEYWQDSECEVQPLIPYKYAVECVCDKLAATKTYGGKNYAPEQARAHWEKYCAKAPVNPKTKLFIERCFLDLEEHGEKYILKRSYMKKTYKEICG